MSGSFLTRVQLTPKHENVSGDQADQNSQPDKSH